MKSMKSMMMGGAILLGLAMCLTSCEGTLDDIFGEWSRPTGNNGNTKTTVAVKSVTLDQTTLTKAVGDDAVTLTATVDPSDASDKTVTWKSSDASIAAVDANGKVTFEAAGTATITATATNGTDDTADDKTAECAVTVNAAAVPATSLSLDKTMKVLVKDGATLTITPNVTPSAATVTWTSSKEAVAIVNNGVVTPVGLGIATITAKSGDLTATCEVFVGNEVALSAAAYEAKNYDILKGNMGANSLTIPAGCHVAFNGVNTNRQIICSGDATIYLTDGSENEVTVSTTNKAGIQIGGTGTTLTINGETAGDGKLTVQGGSGAAGIGTNLDSAGGNIVINGGTVTATGSGGGGAGIGTGETYTSTNECGTITINGGTVTATGGGYAAGIGTGYAYGKTNTCGAITINGGTVNATGGYYAAGIGTGYASHGGNNTCGAITIGTGVKSVTAKKSSSYPGPNSIGKGEAAYGGTQNCGTITIGGVVKAQSEFTGDTYTYTPAN